MPRPVSTYAAVATGRRMHRPYEWSFNRSSILQRRCSKTQPDPEHLGGVEIKLRIEATLDGGGPAEAVLLAGEEEIGDRIALAPERLDHDLGLVGRHDRILLPLEEDHRLGQALRMKERRALAIERLLLRVGSDQPVEIARFELVGVAGKRSRIAHAVIARPARKEVAERERRERGVAAGAAAADHAAPTVDAPVLGQEACAGDAVVHIDHAPAQMQSIAVGATEAGAAAVIDVEHRDPAAGPVLRAEIKRARSSGSGPA